MVERLRRRSRRVSEASASKISPDGVSFVWKLARVPLRRFFELRLARKLQRNATRAFQGSFQFGRASSFASLSSFSSPPSSTLPFFSVSDDIVLHRLDTHITNPLFFLSPDLYGRQLSPFFHPSSLRFPARRPSNPPPSFLQHLPVSLSPLPPRVFPSSSHKPFVFSYSRLLIMVVSLCFVEGEGVAVRFELVVLTLPLLSFPRCSFLCPSPTSSSTRSVYPSINLVSSLSADPFRFLFCRQNTPGTISSPPSSLQTQLTLSPSHADLPSLFSLSTVNPASKVRLRVLLSFPRVETSFREGKEVELTENSAPPVLFRFPLLSRPSIFELHPYGPPTVRDQEEGSSGYSMQSLSRTQEDQAGSRQVHV